MNTFQIVSGTFLLSIGYEYDSKKKLIDDNITYKYKILSPVRGIIILRSN